MRFEHRPLECGHCVQAFLAELDLRDLPGEAAGLESGADDTLPTADLRFYPAAPIAGSGRCHARFEIGAVPARMHSGILTPMPYPVPVPDNVLKEIAVLRQNGKVNMIDRPAVHQLALELGLQSLADWISKHPTQYTEGLSDGFAVTEVDR